MLRETYSLDRVHIIIIDVFLKEYFLCLFSYRRNIKKIEKKIQMRLLDAEFSLCGNVLNDLSLKSISTLDK